MSVNSEKQDFSGFTPFSNSLNYVYLDTIANETRRIHQLT